MDRIEPTQHLTAARDVLLRKLAQIQGQTDYPRVELAVIEQSIESVNLELEGITGSNGARAEMRLQIKSLTNKLAETLIAAEEEPSGHHAAKAEQLMFHLADLRKRLAEI